MKKNYLYFSPYYSVHCEKRAKCIRKKKGGKEKCIEKKQVCKKRKEN